MKLQDALQFYPSEAGSVGPGTGQGGGLLVGQGVAGPHDRVSIHGT